MSAYEAAIAKLTTASFPSRGEWSTFLQLVPAGLGLVKPRQAARQTLELVANTANTKRYISVLGSTRALLRDTRIPIVVDDRRAALHLIRAGDLKRSQRRWLGQVSLQLYFSQLLLGDTAVIDLWPSRLGIDSAGDAVWSPRPVYLKWDPRFLRPLRDLYAGFFLEDQARFDSGVNELGLGSAGGLLLRHLGGGNQRGVRFSSSQLQSMLREISAQPPGHGAGLHRNFAGFGLYVASLHALLESLDSKFDVRGAFIRSYRQV